MILDRNAPLQSNIPTSQNSFYRGIGTAGMDDFLENGSIRPNPAAKQAYPVAYFSEGAPLDRYSGATREQGSHIVESNSPNIQQQKNGYYGAKGLSNADNFTIWKRLGFGNYEKAYQNVAPSALRRGVGAIGSFINKIGFPLQVAETIWNATEDQRNRNAYKKWQAERSNIPMNTEIRMPR